MKSVEIEKALFKKAKGQKAKLKKVYKLKKVEYDAETGKKISEKEELATGINEVFVPPDTTAQIFWLKNRSPRRWREKPESGAEPGEIVIPDTVEEEE